MSDDVVPTRCPNCGQMLYANASAYELSWDERHKRFEVRAEFPCTGCGASADGGIIKLLPLYI